MSNSLSPELIAQLFSQGSDDPFLTLVTLSHTSFAEDIRLVNNSQSITSRGLLFTAFPMRIRLPADDGENQREISLDFDNVSLELINEIRTVTDFINVKIEMILASIPDAVQMEFDELKIQNLTYDKTRISARLFMDDFLQTEVSSERYSPSGYPGIF